MMNRREALKAGCGVALTATGWSSLSWAGEPTASAPRMSDSMKNLDKAVRLLFDEYVRDPSICLAADGTVYFVWHCGKIRKMKPDMSGPAEPGRKLTISVPDPDPTHHSGLCPKIHGENSFDHIGYEGVFLLKIGDTYVLTASDHWDGKYTCWVATSKSLYGPYSARYPAIPHGGHNMFFKDKAGQWWSTIFNGPVNEKPAILPVTIEANGQIALREVK